MSGLPLELLHAGPEHGDLLRNLYQFYAYDSSDWEQEDVEVDGRFHIQDDHLQRYWQSPGWSAQLILVDGFIAGFVLVERSELPGIDAFELADLFVLRKYRRLGVARVIVLQMLADANDWLVRHYRQDRLATMFWDAVLPELPRSVRSIPLDDDADLRNILVSSTTH